ncbi:ribosome-binding factor A [Rickettsiella massiliensis]|uniref:ribosome-binding factor A n=1 Tax=Rickettsiella massiliensis TaxID=676517 RepID=UPI00029B50CA|nr:ribosome-binding factor A [Rickettsiella massiliensis]
MTLKRLQQLSTRLRYLLAQQLNLRIVPKLRFFYDHDQEKSLHLHNLIDQAVAQDEKNAQNNFILFITKSYVSVDSRLN